MPSMKLDAGSQFPEMDFHLVGGAMVSIGGARERWTLFIVYRGKHCPKCKTYLNKLEAMKGDWEAAGFDILVVSADPETKAKADLEEFGWTFPLAYGLSERQMEALGLYISSPLSEAENDRNFAEPGHFCISPSGVLQITCISNGPAARPDLADLLAGMQFNIANQRPPRGLA
ncbi:redoxin domain-containing protein [Pseudahrensia aquimaris]|uniref:Redoxin domain-containing protein n=1 Tax=Pseudahrensia aquimaris TaxID=744461 RepID=A0ABW3FGQ2_9HYPH